MKTPLKPLYVIICTLLVTSSSMLADDDAGKAAKAEEVLRLSNTQQSLRKVVDVLQSRVKEGVLEDLTGVQLTPEKQKDVDAFEDKVWHLVSDAIAWDKVKDDYIKIYVEAFTEKELDDLIVFYKSPTGQALVTKLPDLVSKASAIGEQRVNAVLPELQKMVQDFVTQERGKK